MNTDDGLTELIVSAVTEARDPFTDTTVADAILRIPAAELSTFMHARFDGDGDYTILTTGLPASPGAASGRIVTSAEAAVDAADRGLDVILVRTETTPDDVLGMQSARGILTARGGLVSHAAVVARGWGIPAVVGAGDVIVVDGGIHIGGDFHAEGSEISIDGRTGNVMEGAVVASTRPDVGDLLKGVIIQSGNDACIVLAEGIAGSETAFADLMTTRARELGFESATFRNATGWPVEGHEISAADLAALARYTITEYPEFYSLYGEPNFTWNGITQSNRNPLLGKFTGADGLKTGHTEISKYGLVGSAVRGDDRRIIVVNGLESKKMRSSESLRVMSAAFNDYKVYTLFDDGASVGQAPVFMGEADTIELRASGAAKVGLYRILRKNIKVHLEYDSPIAAPIKAGDKVGELVVSLPGHPKTKFDLVAGADVERQGVFGRAMASLKLKFGN